LVRAETHRHDVGVSRAVIAWLLAVPLAVTASKAAHALAYRLVAPASNHRDHAAAAASLPRVSPCSRTRARLRDAGATDRLALNRRRPFGRSVVTRRRVSITRLPVPVVGRLCAAVGMAASLALAFSPPALAHAALVSSTPANGEVAARAPARIVLRFNESVETALGSVRVYDGSADRVDDGTTRHPQAAQVEVGLRPGLPRGTYTVAWRVVSADSHPIHGAFVFHVGKPGANAAGVAAQVLDEQAGSRSVDVAFGTARFLEFLALLVIVGGALSLVYVLRDEASTLREPVWASVSVVAVLLAVVSLMAIGLEGSKASGLGLSSAARWSLISDVLDTRFGRVSLLRVVVALTLAALGAYALLVRERRGRLLAWLAVGLAGSAALTPALSGHALADGTTAVFSDWAHVLAAGAWAGGLAFLVLVLLRSRERWMLATRIVPRFSDLAVVSISVLLSAGVLSGFLEVRSWSGLWDTTYGRLLLVKVALVLPVLALGAFNNRFSVPRLRAGVASALERRRFLTSVTVELTLAVVIVGVTAALVAEPPARAQVAASGPVSRDTTVGPFDLNLVVDPATPVETGFISTCSTAPRGSLHRSPR
jgi:copper transport protein